MARETGVGVLLRRFRTASGLSQEALAERAGLSTRGISDIERGLKSRPHVYTLQQLADALELSSSDRELLLAVRPVSVTGQSSPSRLSRPNGAGSSTSRSLNGAAPEDRSVHSGPRAYRDTGAYRTNLTDEPTLFIGREREIVAISTLLAQPTIRLVTLTGVGGIGKTRLAMRVGASLLDRFEDGVFFVPFAPVADTDLVAPTIASALALDRQEEKPVAQALQEYLESKHILLVLDNLEHLLDASSLVTTLLETCPGLHILATSRRLLRLAREHAFEVPPMELPDSEQQFSVERLAQFDAVALFVERARAAKYGFTLTTENASSVATICKKLDALPLAIELAAARVRVLPPEALVHRLENKLQLLTGGAQDVPARHQTLRASVDWSYELLTPAQQSLFRRLSIFVGGWTLDAADAVRNREMDILDGMSALTENSLVQRCDGVGGEPRFMMLETIRESGLERLEKHGEMESVQALHAGFYLALAQRAREELGGSQAHIWLQQLEQDLGNVRASLAWARDQGEIDSMLELASSLFLFWERHNHMREGIAWLEEALLRAQDAPPLARAGALKVQAFLMMQLDFDLPRAQTVIQESLELYRAAEVDEEGIAQSLQCLGLVLSNCGADNSAEAKPLFEESLAIWRRLNAPGSIGVLLINLGSLAANEGDAQRAREYFKEAVEQSRKAGDTWAIGVSLLNYGGVALKQRNFAEAQDLCLEALAAFHEIGDKRFAAYTVEHLAELALEERDAKHAVRLMAVGQTIRRPLNLPRPEQFQLCSSRSRTLLSESEWAKAWDEGATMNGDEGIEYALRGGARNNLRKHLVD